MIIYYITGLMTYQIASVVSLSAKFSKYEVQNVSVLKSIGDVRAKAECPLICMTSRLCYGFVFDELQSKCNLLRCGGNGNEVNTSRAYMYGVKTLLARGR